MTMNINEQIESLKRCRYEIQDLQRRVAELAPKAQAYDVLVQVLGLMPRPNGVVYSEDLAAALGMRITELEAKREAMKALQVQNDEGDYEQAVRRFR